MPRIRMCSEQVSDDVKELLKRNEKIGRIRQELCRQASNLSSGWQGPASDAYMNAAGDTNEVIVSRIYKILTLSMGVTEVVKRYEEINEQAYHAADAVTIQAEA